MGLSRFRSTLRLTLKMSEIILTGRKNPLPPKKKEKKKTKLMIHDVIFSISYLCCCLFGFNVAFNNFSVISRWFLVATGSSMAYAHFNSAASLKYHAPDT